MTRERSAGLTRLSGRPGRGDVLVLGAGLGTVAGTLWGTVAERLGAGFECLGLDLPGHGEAPAARGPLTVAALADGARAVAESVSTDDRRAWFAGVSLAGAIGLTLAQQPGPFAGVLSFASASTLGSPEGWLERAAFVRSAGTSAMIDGSVQRWFAPGFVPRAPELVARMLHDLSDTDDESYARCCEALAAYDLSSTLGTARVPCLLAPGEHDQVVTPDRAADDAAVLPDATLAVVAGVAHQPPAEAPDVVTDIVTDFIDRNREERGR